MTFDLQEIKKIENRANRVQQIARKCRDVRNFRGTVKSAIEGASFRANHRDGYLVRVRVNMNHHNWPEAVSALNDAGFESLKRNYNTAQFTYEVDQ